MNRLPDDAVRVRRNKARAVRAPLTVPQILGLERAVSAVFRLIREMHERDPVAIHIKYPSLPPILSESIVIAAAEAIFGTGCRCEYGGSECDIILIDPARTAPLKVEVKATARHAFQELKEKDLRADILVWLRFGTRFETGSGPIEVGMIANPAAFIQTPRRLDINRLHAIPGVADAERVVRFASVEDMLGQPA